MCSDAAVRQQEGEVGDAAARDAGLLAVVDALDEACGAQHVVGQPLAPLTAALARRQRLFQRLRGLVERRARLHRLLQPVFEAALLLGPVALELLDQLTHLLELARRPMSNCFVHRVVAQVELLRRGRRVVGELLARHRQHGVDRRLHGVLALDGERLLRGVEGGGTIGGALVDRGPSLGSDERDAASPAAATATRPTITPMNTTKMTMRTTLRRWCDTNGDRRVSSDVRRRSGARRQRAVQQRIQLAVDRLARDRDHRATRVDRTPGTGWSASERRHRRPRR